MIEIHDYVGIAKIVDPTAVSSRRLAEGGVFHKGAIFCEIPELGMMGADLIYCRYGLSVPYLKIQEGWTVLLRPTVNDTERFFYTGIADCGGSTTPADADQMIIQFASQMIYASTAGKIHLSSKTAAEPFVLGNKLKDWLTNFITATFNAHTHTYVDTIIAVPTTKVSGPPVPTGAAPTDILSTKIMGE